MARVYRSEYENRNTRAIEQGFTGYNEKREALEEASSSDLFNEGYPFGGDARDPEYLEAVGVYWSAFGGAERDYTTGSALSRWFVEYAEIMDYDEWEERYGGTK